MDIAELLQPILSGGIRNTNYVNGRILAAEDLKDDQKAERLRQQLYGQALGDGVAHGLVVMQPQANQTIVHITPGLAINRKGQTLSLSQALDLHLVRQTETQRGNAGLFVPCEPPQAGAILTNAGFYVLTLSPVSDFAEQVPLFESIGANVTNMKCVSRYAVEGVQFRLARLELNSLTNISAATRNQVNQLTTLNDTASLSKLRNLAAHLFFGAEERAAFVRDPFKSISEQARYGALESMRALGSVTDCDVPLALIHWTASGIKFVDMWAVRRRIIAPSIMTGIPGLADIRRDGEAEAICMQFVDHLETIRRTVPNLESVVATQFFRFLPAFGMLPLTGTARGFNFSKFFEGRVFHQPVFVEAARVEFLLRMAQTFPPIDLNNDEMVWLYLVRENLDARAFAEAPPPLQYLIFASGHVPFIGAARFDVARSDFSHFTSTLALSI